MCGQQSSVGYSDASCRLAKDVARFFRHQEPLSGGGLSTRVRIQKRPLWIESLEPRCMMDAAGLAATVSPDWFAVVTDSSTLTHANVTTYTAEGTVDESTAVYSLDESSLYDWIVQFDTASLGGISSVAGTAALLAGGGIDFQVICGLGLVGQTLVRSSGASFEAVEDFLAANANVAAYELDAVRQVEVTSNDPLAYTVWANSTISADDAWAISTGSASVVVAVIDTGVDYTHPDLAANIWTNPGEIAGNGIDDDGNGFVDDVHGYDFFNNDGDPMDDNMHGTHVAGTIAAVGNNGVGVVGVNWTSSIMALKFLSAEGYGSTSDAIRAINYATMMRERYGVNVRVENNSWGGGSYSVSLQNAIKLTGDAGILFVAAAGNSGSNNDAYPQYPASYNCTNIISVAATTQYDTLASFSCYGATSVDIAAPGVNIYSTLPGGRYGALSGTSMASPQVAGAAALAWAVNPYASLETIRNAILGGADPVSALSGRVVTGGRLNVCNTISILDSPVTSPAPPTATMPGLQFVSQVGLYDATTSTFYLRNSSADGTAGSSFVFAPAYGAMTAIVGDWNGDGVDTVGLYDAATSRFYLTNSTDGQGPVIVFTYGPANLGWLPVVGDWNGDGRDTIGLYNPNAGKYFLRNTNSTGYADIAFTYGPGGFGWICIVGDWDGDGRDTIGLYDANMGKFYLRNANSTGYAHAAFTFGPSFSGWISVSGDWNGDGRDTVGLYDPNASKFYLRNSNKTGYADVAFGFGSPYGGFTPVVGDWNGGQSVSQLQSEMASDHRVHANSDRSFGRLNAAASYVAFAASLASVEASSEGLYGANPTAAASDLLSFRLDDAVDAWDADVAWTSIDDDLFDVPTSSDLEVDVAQRLEMLQNQIDELLNEFGPAGAVAQADAGVSDASGDDFADGLLTSGVTEQSAIDGLFETFGQTVS